VYVKRPGKRHWNVDRAEEIIGRQLVVLDDIEQVIADVDSMVEAGTLNRLDFENVSIARQRVALRSVLARSRAIYEGLLEEARSQKAARDSD
jgi:hypothetical protein